MKKLPKARLNKDVSNLSVLLVDIIVQHQTRLDEKEELLTDWKKIKNSSRRKTK